MPRPKSVQPSLCLHKPSGRAYVTLGGRQCWLGVYGSPESEAAYDRVVGEWLMNGRRGPQPAAASVTVATVLGAFLTHAETFYVDPATTSPSREVDNFRLAMRPVRRLYGSTPAVKFGPKALRVVRLDMVKAGLCRNVVNRRIARVVQIFRWAASVEMVAASVHLELATVTGLRKGKDGVRESQRVRAIPQERIDAVLPYLPAPVRAAAKLQLLTGMRSSEVLTMRTGDISTTGPTWHYIPQHHKCEHHDGHDRDVVIGPQAQEILKPWLQTDLQAFIFRPGDAMAEMRARRSEARRTPISCGHRPGSNRKAKPQRRPKARYDRNSYLRCITRACEKAFALPKELREPQTLEAKAADTTEAKKKRQAARRAWREENVWSPHQLRHTFATNVRREAGLDMARQLLGHRTAKISEEYAERDARQAELIASKIG